MASGDRRLEISLDGSVDETLNDDLIELEVCDAIGEHGTFSMKLVMRKLDSGDWTHVDTSGPETVLKLWQRFTVRAGFGSDMQVIIDGYIAGVTPYFANDESLCELTIWGYDASWSLDQEEKVVRWEDKTFTDAATAIFQSYGLTPQVDDTTVQYQQDDVTLIQRATDWEFLCELGQRVGFEVFVEGGTGYFRAPVLDRPVQHDVGVFFGPSATNAVWFRPNARTGFPSTVGMQRIDAAENKIDVESVTASTLPALGKTDNKGIYSGRTAAAGTPTLATYTRPVTSQPELLAMANGLRQGTDWYVDGEGELDGNLYGVILRAKRPVLIKGLGTAWSGTYYVSRVVHQFTPTAYRQRFWVMRNRTGASGSESYEAVSNQSAAINATSVVTVTTATSGTQVKP